MKTFRAEVLKVVTTKLWWVTTLCVLLMGMTYAALPGLIALEPEAGGVAEPFTDRRTVLSMYNGGNAIARVFVLVFGLLTVGSEYRYKTIALTFLATPRRLRVILSKALVVALFGLAFGVVNLVAGVTVAAPFLLFAGGDFFLSDPATWRSLGLGVASMALWALIGTGVGVLVPSLVTGLLVGIGFAYLVEPSLAALFFFQEWTLAQNLLPSGATNAMLELNSPVLLASPDPWPWWGGLGVLAGWSLAPALAGLVFSLRRDVD